MAKLSHTKSRFRQCISGSNDEIVIFATDILGEPQREVFARLNPHVYCKCSRALPIANNDDIVALSGKLEPQYYNWLRSLKLGPKHVVAYGRNDCEKSLSELILEDSAPIKDIIKAEGRSPVLVPFYSGQFEKTCAELLQAELFGSDVDICRKYFNKSSFKQICESLDIPTVGGASLVLEDFAQPIDAFEQIVSAVLTNYSKVIIRGGLGSSGSSLYQADATSKLVELYEEIKRNRDRTVLIEPMLKVVASPNDQWVIDRSGTIHHLGMSAQLFKELSHAGNMKGQYFSGRTYKRITAMSRKIVKKMAEDGYTGTLGIDYIITDEGIFPIENNARLNGSSFTYGIVDQVEKQIGAVPCWKFYKANTTARSFKDLSEQLGSILYAGKKLNRVFPFDCDTLEIDGNFAMLLLAEDMYHVDFMEEALNFLGIERIQPS